MGDFARLYLEAVSCTNKATRENTLGPSTIRCSAQILSICLKARAARAERKCPKKPKRVFGVNDPLSGKFRSSVRNNSWRHRFTFSVQISLKSAAEKWAKRCVVWVTQKFATCGFSPPVCAHLARKAPKVYSEACHLTKRLHVKFRPSRFRFAGVFAEKVISYDRHIIKRFSVTFV